MLESEKWERLMKSIRRAALILGIDLTERDTPEYLNWPIARQMKRNLWDKVERRRRNGVANSDSVILVTV